MAQPTTYNRAYSFTSFQAGDPSSPLPAAQVDLEFNLVKQTLDEVLANLALIQRDDGEVANATIGHEQLTSGVLAGIEAPTTWVTATDYALNDTVFESNKFYICAEAHTSGTFATDLAAEKWTLIADFAAAFSAATDAAAAAEAAKEAAETAETNAETAETNAAASAAAASTSASNASTSASNAATSAANAATAETNAETAEANAEAAEANALAYASRYKGTSTTAVTIGTGSQGPFTTQADKFFDVGVWVLIASDADPTDYMHGQVTAYTGTALTVNVTNVGGSGEHSDWTITVAGTRGAKGDQGAAGAGSGDLVSTNNLSDVDTAATAFDNIKQDATASYKGVVELATNGEAQAGTDTVRALTAANVASMIGAQIQAYSANLAAIAALAVTDGNVAVGNGSTWVAESGATLRTSIGVGTGDSPQFTGIELGHASDTTIARIAAGRVSIEGAEIATLAGTQTLTNKTLGAVTLSGAVTGGAQTISDVFLDNYEEEVAAIGSVGGGAQNIDASKPVSTATVDTSTTTFSFTNPPSSGNAGSFTLILTNGGSQTVNWPAAVKWAGGTAPTLTTAGIDILTFVTVDGGTIWYGFAAGLDMQ